MSEVCAKCGWYVEWPTHHCKPEAGAAVSKLQGAVAARDSLTGTPHGIKTTRLGYGSGNVVFETDDDFLVRLAMFDVDRGFRLERVFLLDSMDEEAATDLVLVLAEWRKRHRERKGFR